MSDDYKSDNFRSARDAFWLTLPVIFFIVTLVALYFGTPLECR